MEKLVRGGPFPAAREALAELDDVRLTAELSARVALMRARMARVEGRWDEASRQQRAGSSARTEDAEEATARAERSADLARAAVSRRLEQAEASIARLKQRRPFGRLPTIRLFNIMRIATRAGIVETVDDVLAVLVARNLPPRLRFDAAIIANGVGDDAHVGALFESVAGRRGSVGVAARYHWARVLERQGDFAAAEREYNEVIERERGQTRWYTMWSQLHLPGVNGQQLSACEPESANDTHMSVPLPSDSEPPMLASLAGVADTRAGRRPAQLREGLAAPGTIPPAPRPAVPDYEVLADELEPIAEEYAEAFPWFGRAEDLLRLHEPTMASDELYEGFLAWRESIGRRVAYAGLESVSRGGERRRIGGTFAVRRDRRLISSVERNKVADVAEAIGDLGSSVGFGGWDRAGERPRPHIELVEAAAAKHGVDPNLLFAVMRVESVYQRRVVSYAGAIGLMQIMPRTGRHIADRLDHEDFTTRDLLDPAVNLDFAAWYLGSLIERFDGHLPLAIASYNGGPHNVRRWLRDHAVAMPMDAFLERIPFNQTHRYVRRVLTHYAAYRAQLGLPMLDLSEQLPVPEPDSIAF
jgi:soluble lytic murein transglycosylase